MFKNVASQSIALFAFDTATGLPKTGDAANILLYVAKDWGTVTAIAASSGVPTEMDATNAKGLYKIALSQTETNADALQFSGKSVTAGVSVVSLLLYTLPANFTTLAVDSSGRVTVGAIVNGAIAAATFAANALDAVWSTATRVLTAGTNIALAKGTGVTGFNDLDSAGVRGAVGLASANLDTQLSGINTKTANLPADPTSTAAITAQFAAVNAGVAAVPSANANADALLDRANGIETGVTPRQGFRVWLAALAGKANGLAGTTVHYRDTGDTKDRITATVDGNGNRTAVTLDPS